MLNFCKSLYIFFAKNKVSKLLKRANYQTIFVLVALRKFSVQTLQQNLFIHFLHTLEGFSVVINILCFKDVGL